MENHLYLSMMQLYENEDVEYTIVAAETEDLARRSALAYWQDKAKTRGWDGPVEDHVGFTEVSYITAKVSYQEIEV